MTALREPPPEGTLAEDVPGSGACLFHAIAQTQDVGEARTLRLAVVEFVVQNWEANPDIGHLLGSARRAVQPVVLLQVRFAVDFGCFSFRLLFCN